VCYFCCFAMRRDGLMHWGDVACPGASSCFVVLGYYVMCGEGCFDILRRDSVSEGVFGGVGDVRRGGGGGVVLSGGGVCGFHRPGGGPHGYAVAGGRAERLAHAIEWSC